MPRRSSLKQQLLAGRPAIGCWLHTASADAAEILGGGGFDFLLIDHEHGPAGFTDAVAQIRAAQAGSEGGDGPVTLMRVPWNDKVYLKRALDCGVSGVMIPNVESAQAARAAVAACKFPPAGVRSAAGIIRAAGYGADPGYFGTIDEDVLVICQIETKAAVEQIAEIGAVPGVDVLFIGPRDLSGSIGKGGRYDDPEVQALIARAEADILKSGRVLGSIASDAAAASAMLARGYQMVLPTSDVTLLREGALAVMAALRDKL